MARKLKAGEVDSVLQALTDVNRSLASCLESLAENQKQLEKSMKCQTYLSYPPLRSVLLSEFSGETRHKKLQSLKPIQTGFVQRENADNGSESGERV